VQPGLERADFRSRHVWTNQRGIEWLKVFLGPSEVIRLLLGRLDSYLTWDIMLPVHYRQSLELKGRDRVEVAHGYTRGTRCVLDLFS